MTIDPSRSLREPIFHEQNLLIPGIGGRSGEADAPVIEGVPHGEVADRGLCERVGEAVDGELIEIVSDPVALGGGGRGGVENFDTVPTGSPGAIVGDAGRFEAHQVTAADLRFGVVGGLEVGEIGAIAIVLDLFQQNIDAHILVGAEGAAIGAEKHLEVLRPRGLDSDRASEFEGEGVSDQGLVGPGTIEDHRDDGRDHLSLTGGFRLEPGFQGRVCEKWYRYLGHGLGGGRRFSGGQ